MYTAASLFSGIGGLDLAFSWVGFDIRVQVEIDDYCRQVLKKHAPQYWRNAKQLKDIKNVRATQLGNIDVMFGGFPCQDISIAGQRAGITEQTRSGLWFEFLRLIRQVRPKAVVLENVAAIHFPTTDDSGHKQPSPGLIVTASLAEVGYDAIWLPVRASDVGAPHQRERWFCIAYRVVNSNQQRRYRASVARPSSRHKKRNAKNRQWSSQSPETQSANEMVHAQSKRQQKGRKLRYLKQKEWVSRSEYPMADTESKGLEGRNGKEPGKYLTSRPCWGQRRYAQSGTQSRLGRAANGLPGRLDRHNGQFPSRPDEAQYDYEPSRVTGRREYRRERIQALGNAVVPQQALPIALAVKQFLDRTA